MPNRISLTALTALVVGMGTAHAEGPRPSHQTFALIIGVNRPQEPGLAPLRFADDDAFKYEALFRTLGAQTITLTVADENSRRLYDGPKTSVPTRQEFDGATKLLAGLVKAAHAKKQTTTVYFIYAGHGARDETTNDGFLTLADGRLGARDLFSGVVDQIGAGTFHFIVDACNSQFLTETRGPGGKRRPLPSFAHEVARRALDQRVGLLFASSSMTKTFEYEGFAAGVFSHLVRSGLYGAADFDLDGIVTYEELQRFVAVAAAPISNELYRPRVHALPPVHTKALADVRAALGNRIVIDGALPAAHHVVEDRNGVRLIDFHNATGETVHLLWPKGALPLFVYQEDGSEEVQLDAAAGALVLAQAPKRTRRAVARGAADHAFRSLFALPFSGKSVAQIDLQTQTVEPDPNPSNKRHVPRTAKAAFWTAGGLAAASAAAFGAAALTLDADKNASTDKALALNKRAEALQWAAGVGLGLAAAAAITGWVLLALPHADDNDQVDGGSLSLQSRW